MEYIIIGIAVLIIFSSGYMLGKKAMLKKIKSREV